MCACACVRVRLSACVRVCVCSWHCAWLCIVMRPSASLPVWLFLDRGLSKNFVTRCGEYRVLRGKTPVFLFPLEHYVTIVAMQSEMQSLADNEARLPVLKRLLKTAPH